MISKVLAIIAIAAKSAAASVCNQARDIFVALVNAGKYVARLFVSAINHILNIFIVGLRFLRQTIVKIASWLWTVYCHTENQVLLFFVDVGLGVYTARYLAIILSIGLLLYYFRFWLLLAIYQ